jgi:hypothetical protein
MLAYFLYIRKNVDTLAIYNSIRESGAFLDTFKIPSYRPFKMAVAGVVE